MLTGIFSEGFAHFVHGLVEINFYDLAAEGVFIDFGEVFCRVAFQFFEEDAFARYFSQDLSVGRAGIRQCRRGRMRRVGAGE